MLSLGVLNGAMAIACCAICVCWLDIMKSPKMPALVAALVTLLVGLLGTAASSFNYDAWQAQLDTLLLGGLLGFMIANRRMPTWISPIFAQRVSFGVSLSAWGVFLLTIKGHQ